MFIEYLKDDENTIYTSAVNGRADDGTKNRTRTKQTLDNILNYTLYDIYSKDQYFMIADNYVINEFKNNTHNEQVAILKHILRIQAYTIRKAILNKVSMVVPVLGRFTYNKYRELALNIYAKYNKIENGSIINYLIKSIIKDLLDSERREKRKQRLSIRKDVPYLQLEDFNIYNKQRNLADERYNSIKQ